MIESLINIGNKQNYLLSEETKQIFSNLKKKMCNPFAKKNNFKYNNKTTKINTMLNVKWRNYKEENESNSDIEVGKFIHFELNKLNESNYEQIYKNIDELIKKCSNLKFIQNELIDKIFSIAVFQLNFCEYYVELIISFHKQFNYEFTNKLLTKCYDYFNNNYNKILDKLVKKKIIGTLCLMGRLYNKKILTFQLYKNILY